MNLIADVEVGFRRRVVRGHETQRNSQARVLRGVFGFKLSQTGLNKGWTGPPEVGNGSRGVARGWSHRKRRHTPMCEEHMSYPHWREEARVSTCRGVAGRDSGSKVVDKRNGRQWPNGRRKCCGYCSPKKEKRCAWRHVQ